MRPEPEFSKLLKLNTFNWEKVEQKFLKRNRKLL